ncbi:MAG: hypothetical protein K0R65_2885 [Crocinitomicaceae bacterium]|jgi:hypothetical protein|nr:hypothetical protein [Crocinitomicaceae bacterium]
MPLTEKQAKRTNLILDLAVFTALALFAMNTSMQADPGEIIFLFVFENLVMALAFAVFFIIFSPWHNSYLKKHRLLKNPARPRIRIPLFKAILYALLGFGIVFCISMVVLIFLNQMAVELMISFLKDNAYNFKSIEILSGGMFFDGSIIRSLQRLFGQSYVVFFWVLLFKHLLSNILVFVSHPDLKSNNFLTLAGTRAVISQTIMSPVAVFLACLLLVALSALYGAQTWIILVTLGAFRLIFLLLSISTSRFFTTV